MRKHRRPNPSGSSIIVNQAIPRSATHQKHLLEQVTGKPMPTVSEPQPPVIESESEFVKAFLWAFLAAVCVFVLMIAAGVGVEFIFYAIYGGEPLGWGFIAGAVIGAPVAVLISEVAFEELDH